MPFFRQHAASSDPACLLDPDNQLATPWGSADHGPCDKCERQGSVHYRCLSCIEIGPRPECPACQGRVEFVGVCPTCGGDGEITSTERRGTSVFPTLAGLYRYLVEREFDFEGQMIVILEGDLSLETDLDADSGALLVHPLEIIGQRPIDLERVEDLRRRLAPLGAES